MENRLKTIGNVYGVVGSIGALILSITLGRVNRLGYGEMECDFSFLRFFIYFLFLEFSVIMVVSVFYALDYIVDLCDEINEKITVGDAAEKTVQDPVPSKQASNSKADILSLSNDSNHSSEWICRKCGSKNPISSMICKDCGQYR